MFGTQTSRSWWLCSGLSLLLAAPLGAQDEGGAADEAAPTKAEQKAAKAKAEQEAREKAFVEKMTGVQLVGSFTVDGMPDDEPLPRDKYTIYSIKRQIGKIWVFTVRIEYGGKDIKLPIPVPIEWAGDTPVISVTGLPIPGSGVYTARVLFYGDRYAGTWDGKDFGGVMFGSIVPMQDEEKDGEDKENDRKEQDDSDKDGKKDDGVLPSESQDSSAVEEVSLVTSVLDGADPWPSFRGPGACGVSDGNTLASKWDGPNDSGIKWSTEIPGMSHASPVTWGDSVFVISSVPTNQQDAELKVGLYGSIQPVETDGPQQYLLMALDKYDGEILWEEVLWEGEPAVKRHPKGSHAACTPATDGEHVVAFFGSEGLFCSTTEGDLVWKRDLGLLDSGYYLVPDAQWGFSSCPVIYGDKVLVQCDVQGQSFLAALSLKDGSDVWRTERDEVPTWGTPTVDVRPGRRQVLCNGFKHIGSYDLDTGAELWKLVGGGDIPVPTPVVAHDLVYFTNAHGRMAPILAVDAMAEGTLTIDADGCEGMAWSYRNRGNYMQTPLVYGKHLYMCSDAGIVSCYDAKTGTSLYRERLGLGNSGFSASAVAGDGKLYFTSEEGEIHVIKAGPEFEKISVNSMGEECMATPAISEGVIYFRTRRHVMAVEEI